MTQKILDAADIQTNTDRFCSDCRELVEIKMEDRLEIGPFRTPTLQFYRLAKRKMGWCYNQGLWKSLDDPDRCEMCSLLLAELTTGPDDETLARLPDLDIAAFALPGDAAAQFLRVLQLPPDPSSDQVFEKDREWIKTCCDSHKQCKVIGQEGLSFLPTRVIDVGTSEKDAIVRLHVSAEGERGAYACLSYCWGGDQFKLTRDNLEKLEIEIPMGSLSLTVADGIEAARRLGLRYLWVDALCIIQDSDEDKAREIVQMGAIYKNSTITIAAATASASTQGFLRTPRKPPPAAVINLPLPNGEVGPVHMTLYKLVKAGSRRSKRYHPLDGRGWCLQEYLLSPRLLYFSHWNVEWQCQHGEVQLVHEDLFGDKKKAPHSATFRLPPGLFGKATASDVLDKYGRHLGNGEVWDRSRLFMWRQVVEEYSKRGLTVRSDKLPALAGIAGELAHLWKYEYMFGMWKELFPWLVGWTAATPGKRVGQIPSWSWASVSEPVEFMKMRSARLLDFSLEASGGQQEKLAGSSSGIPRLTVTGTLIGPQAELFDNFIDGKEEFSVWPDLDEAGDTTQWSFLVIDSAVEFGDTVLVKHNTTLYMVLRQVEDGAYERIGLAKHTHKRSSLLGDDSQWMKMTKAKPTARIHLV